MWKRNFVDSSTLKQDLQACLTFVVTPMGVASVGPAPLAPDGSSARGAPGVQARLCLIPPRGEVFLGQGLLFDKGVVGKPLECGRKLHYMKCLKWKITSVPCHASGRFGAPVGALPAAIPGKLHPKPALEMSTKCRKSFNNILRKFLLMSSPCWKHHSH